MAELARGAVTDRPWGRTLAAIGLRSMSGQLTVMSDQREYAIVFSQGAVVGAYSPLPADSVARVALTAGLLSAAQVQEVARRPLGHPALDDGTDAVVEIGRLTPDQVARLRRRATAHRAARTFALERGEFVLTDTITIGWHPDAAVDVRAVIYLGARLTLSEHRLLQDLGLLGTSFRLRDDAIAELPQFGFTEQERPILTALRQGANLQTVEHAAEGVDQRLVRAAIYSLACTGAVDSIGDAQVQAAAPPVRPSAPSIPRTRTGNTATADAAVSRTATPSPAAQRPSAPPPLHAAAARTAAPTGRRSSPVLPQVAAPSAATVAAATRTPTPPDPPRTTTPPPPRRVSGPLPAIPGSEPPSTSAAAARARAPSPPQPPAKADVRVPTAGASPRNPLAASEIQSIIKAKVALVDQGADYFLLLGIKPDAPIEVVRSAFYGLVRRLHPDLLIAVGLKVTDESQRLMARLNEAYAVLSSPERRREYELSLGNGVRQSAEAIVTAAITAEERYRRGNVALKRDDLAEAVREFEAAFELKKDEGDYLAMLTWARFCAAPNKEAAVAAARQGFERAARLAPESVTPRFWYGRLERVLGRSQQALGHFRWVVEQDPRHAEAAAEIRVLVSRDQPPGRGPLLKKR